MHLLLPSQDTKVTEHVKDKDALVVVGFADVLGRPQEAYMRIQDIVPGRRPFNIGNFRSNGRMLFIESGDKYLAQLASLKRVDLTVLHKLLARIKSA
jgi:hypothetical protein